MSAALRIDERVVGGGQLADPVTGNRQTAMSGVGVLPDRRWSLAHGTASGQANQWYLGRRTCLASSSDNLDLSGVLTNFTGTITLTKVKRLLVIIIDPNGTKSLRVGPNNVANAAQLWFGGVGAGQYATVVDVLDVRNQFAGWTVTAGTGDILPISNPGLTDVTYAIWIVGVQ